MQLAKYGLALLLMCSVNHFCIQAQTQQVPIIKFNTLKSYLQSYSDTTYIINFWATWCKPCVAELPAFIAIDGLYKGQPVKVILISLDFKRQYEERLVPFIKNRKITATTMLIDETDYNSWIDKVDPSWSGAIPATLIINGKWGKRKFFEKEFTFEELKNEVEQFCNPAEIKN